MWSCPICKNSLYRADRVYRCKNNHNFDISKSGYVHLLPANCMHGRMPGDNKLMVDSRRRFLESGHYRPLAERVAQLAARYAMHGNLLDVGCGEGYYTGYVAEELSRRGRDISVYGVDISKIAIEKAAKRYKGVSFSVGSAFHIPVPDNSCCCVLNLFAPYCGTELSRVLIKDGYMIMAIPGADHLWELKDALYDVPYKNEVKPFELEGFDLVDTCKLQYTMELCDQQTIVDLFCMTPYYYKTGEKDQKKLQCIDRLSVMAQFIVLVYRVL